MGFFTNFLLLKFLESSKEKTLKWSEVQTWIAEHGNPDNIGRGYANLTGRFPSPVGNPYVDLRKEIFNDGMEKGVRLHATVVFNQNQGPASTKTWEVQKLDSELEKMFGHNLRVRLRI